MGVALPVASRAEGCYIFDTEGKGYLDGCSGAIVSNLGHGDPRVLATMREQSERITFAHRGAFSTDQARDLAEKLSGLFGYPGVILCNSGSEAIETAMRLALQYHRELAAPRHRFVSHSVSYHGATIGALSLSGNIERRSHVEAVLHGFHELTPPYYYRYANDDEDELSFGTRLIGDAIGCLSDVDRQVAALVVEPVGGAAGAAITPPDNYLPGLADACRTTGTLLIADEVMCGLGRTGKLLASAHWGVEPDLVVLGKGLGAGFTPVSAVLVNARVRDTIAAGSGTIPGGHTYAGNPLGAAVANTILDIVTGDQLIGAAAERGVQLGTGLRALESEHRIIGEVRGLGLLQAVELVSDPMTKVGGTPIGSLAARLTASALDAGLTLYAANGGINDAVIVAPPLTISKDEVDELLVRLRTALDQAA